MNSVREGIVTRSVEIFPQIDEDLIKFHGEGTLKHPDIQRQLESIGKVRILNIEAGLAAFQPPIDEVGKQLLADTIDEVYPSDITMVSDRRGDLPYANPTIYPSRYN